MASPIVPIPAATVILVRSAGQSGWQCFMVRRHARSEFAADVFVFPGGKVDAADSVVGFPLADTLPVGVRGQQTWNALLAAAIRELFEEAGVLLARTAGGSMVSLAGAGSDTYSAHRRQLQTGKLTLARLLAIERLTPAADALHPFSRWITPEDLPRRYDTWFFAAELPNNQAPLHDAIETTDSFWVSPREALAKYQRGEFPLVFATEMHLKRLAHYDTIRGLLAGITSANLQPIMPRIVQTEHETAFLLPGDEGYD